MEDKINTWETRMCKAVFPNTLNMNGTLFGGLAMQWIDETAYLAATRFTRQKMFTVSVDNVRFLKTIRPNSIVEVIARIEDPGPVKLKVKAEIYAEPMYEQKREKVVECTVVFAKLSDNLKPEKIEYSFSEN